MTRSDLSEGLLDDEIQLFSNESFADEAVAEGARDIWRKYYGVPRKRGKSRSDCGCHRAKKEGTESAWKRRRNEDTNAAANVESDIDNGTVPDVRAFGSAYWIASHGKEAAFQ